MSKHLTAGQFEADLQTLRERVDLFDDDTPEETIIRWAVRTIAGDKTRLERMEVGAAMMEKHVSGTEEQ